jgi:hypothetical protein
LRNNGFEVATIERRLHDGALVVEATKVSSPPTTMPVDQRDDDLQQLLTLCDEWNTFTNRVRALAEASSEHVLAIYGAGFYGSLVYSLLDDTQNVVEFVDRNPHLQHTTRLGLPVVDPAALNLSVTGVISGLRPTIARDVLSHVPEWQSRNLAILIP